MSENNLQISVFTEHLQELASYSERLDNCLVNDSDFVDFQRLIERITNAHNTGYYEQGEYQALYHIAQYLREEFRLVLKYNQLEV